MPRSDEPADLFTGDDYQLVADAIYREEDRRELFERHHGIPAPTDDHLERLTELARRISIYLQRELPQGESGEAAP